MNKLIERRMQRQIQKQNKIQKEIEILIVKNNIKISTAKTKAEISSVHNYSRLIHIARIEN